MFNLEIGEAPHKSAGENDEEANHNNLENMIKELAATLKTVKNEQEYMQVIFYSDYNLLKDRAIATYGLLKWSFLHKDSTSKHLWLFI